MKNNEHDKPTGLFGLSEKFKFRCTQCGKCCKSRHDILLSPFDIYRMAKILGVSHADIITKYCDIYIGKDSKLPLVAINMEDGENCPLMDSDNKCIVQKGKPTVCALFPLGRKVRIDREEGQIAISYFLQNANCGETDEEHSVNEWLESFGLDFFESNMEFVEWTEVTSKLSERMRLFATVMPGDAFGHIADAVATELYADYDTGKPIIPQFGENIKRIDQIVEKVNGLLESAVRAANDKR